MPIIKSAKKRVRVAKRQGVANSKTRRNLRESVRKFQNAILGKKDSTKAQSEAFSAIDTAVKKGIISKNKAARKKSQLNAKSKAAGTTKTGAKKPAKSPAAKATTVKKSVPKKAPAKKKPVVKKK